MENLGEDIIAEETVAACTGLSPRDKIVYALVFQIVLDLNKLAIEKHEASPTEWDPNFQNFATNFFRWPPGFVEAARKNRCEEIDAETTRLNALVCKLVLENPQINFESITTMPPH